ncbi:MAG: glycosyltransferase family 39 protein [Chloroflexi bacterium]|nr:glycosyltransferase family 39 protein [Chloroflexota bacterium]MCI0576120.1 glycosyltransferase family 39 protein [Chloroflexota bacterium]MCI0647908.1 glycosyltransferase family 39 protein [Chloroflexota bacterium]MCI0727159.1 glycosyltransferase family 39 protein [Chloroflexota bacterium]
MSRNVLLLFLLASLTLLLIFTVLTDVIPSLRGPAPETSEWYWPYLLRPPGRWWPAVLAALAVLGVAAWWFRQPDGARRAAAVALSGLAAGSLLLQLGLVYADRPELFSELVDRTLSNLESGFFQPAAEVEELNATLRRYPQAMPGFASEHARTHPPGLLVANRLTIEVLAAAPQLSEAVATVVRPARCADLWLLERPASVAAALAVWALLPLLAAALSPLPAYALARRLMPPAAARLATVLVATLPALLLFAPKSVQLYVPLTLVLWLAFHHGLVRRAGRWLFLAGLLFSLAIFSSLGNAVLLLPLAVYAGLVWQPTGDHQSPAHGRARPAILRSCLAFSLGAAGPWLVYWLGWGVPPWAVVRVGLQQHYELVTSQRRYDWWLVYNLVDLLVWAGLPLLAGFAGAVAVAARRLRRRSWQPVDALALGLGLLIVALDVSGSTRGEVGRLWLFFMPLLALPAADFLGRVLPGRLATLLVIGLQLLLALSLGLAWRPVRAVIVVAQRPAMPAEAPPQFPLSASFSEPGRQGETLRLAGYDLDSSQAVPGGFLELALHWQASRPAQRPYTVFTHLVNESGLVVAQKDNWPLTGQWPPTCWRRDDQIVDPYRIELPADLPPGDYTLLVGLYDAASNARLLAGDGLDAVQLTTITVSPTP